LKKNLKTLLAQTDVPGIRRSYKMKEFDLPALKKQMPLCVDLDDTLLKTDLLWESILSLLKEKPWMIFKLAAWLLAGKVTFKNEIAKRVRVNPEILPYREKVIDFLKAEKKDGREIVLATASHISQVAPIAEHLALFDAVVATDETENLIGRRKAEKLAQLYGEKGFDYIGDSVADLRVWEKANNAFLVNPSVSLKRQAEKLAKVSAVFQDPKIPRLQVFAKAIRVHQWVKNLLIFLPMVLAHRFFEVELLTRAVWAFISFSFCASSVYLLNDLFDLDSDRLHPSKRFRPLASGNIPIPTALILSLSLLTASFIGAFLLLSADFLAVLAAYFILTTSYSLLLKRLVLVDVFVLAGLYAYRLHAGSVATQVPVSEWLLAFSMFFFLSLAFVKRYTELHKLSRSDVAQASGRGYFIADLDVIRSLGAASGYISVLVLALYISNPQVRHLYEKAIYLWFLVPALLYWKTKLWLLAHRGKLDDDPVVAAIKDPLTYVLLLVIAVIMTCSI